MFGELGKPIETDRLKSFDVGEAHPKVRAAISGRMSGFRPCRTLACAYSCLHNYAAC